MKRLLCTSVMALGVLAAVAVGSATAAESDGRPPSYRASYVDPNFGVTSCIGVHLTGADGTATSGGLDVFVCKISERLTRGATYTEQDMSWCSDYFAQPSVLGECVEATDLEITVGGTGRLIVGRASYS